MLDRYKYAIITALVAIGCVPYYFVDPSRYSIMPRCPVKLLTSLDCPGCGFQRALHATLHGHIEEAIGYNLFLLVAIPVVGLWCLNGLMIEHTSSDRRRRALIGMNKALVYLYIIGYLLWFVIRNVYSL